MFCDQEFDSEALPQYLVDSQYYWENFSESNSWSHITRLNFQECAAVSAEQYCRIEAAF